MADIIKFPIDQVTDELQLIMQSLDYCREELFAKVQSMGEKGHDLRVLFGFYDATVSQLFKLCGDKIIEAGK